MSFKKLNLLKYWNEVGLSNVKPMSLRYGEYPEGWSPIDVISRITTPLVAGGSVVELGCGYGRLCNAFNPLSYLGLDINKNAIKLAQENNPEYIFQEIDFVATYPSADNYFAYTVFLHIDDGSLHRIVSAITSITGRVIVAEILSDKSKISRKINKIKSQFSSHPYFPRNRSDYVNLFGEFNFQLTEEFKKPYHFYAGAEISFLVFEKQAELPTRLSEFPACLHGSSRIEALGLHEDGWLADKLTVSLRNDRNMQQFSVSMLIPHIDAVSGAHIEIKIDGATHFKKQFPGGEFHFSKALEIEEGDHAVEISISPSKQLPKPDGRKVTALLRTIGFERVHVSNG